MTQDDLRRALNALGRIPVERVEEIMQAEHEGRLVVLPCKGGRVIGCNMMICYKELQEEKESL